MSALRRYAGFVALLATAAILLGWYLTRSWGSSDAARNQADARARLSACLVGAPPTSRGLDVRLLRSIQLAGAPGWPQRCATYVKQLDPSSTVLADGKLFEFLSVDSSLTQLVTPEDGEPSPSANAASGVVPPPAPIELVHDLVPVEGETWDLSAEGDTDLSIAFDHAICHFAAQNGGLEPVAHCTFVADALARAQRLELVAGEQQLVNADDGVWNAVTGTRVIPTTTSPEAAIVDGSPLTWEASSRTLSYREASGHLVSRRLATVSSSSQLVGDQLLWRVFAKDNTARVVAAAVHGGTLGTPVEVARGISGPWGRRCYTPDVAAVLLPTPDDLDRLAVFSGGKWTVTEPGPSYRLTCTGNRVVGIAAPAELTSAGAKIDRIDCTNGECRTHTVTLPTVIGPVGAAAIGDETLVVWADEIVRAVRGPIASLPTQTPFAVFDGYRFEALQREVVAEQQSMLHRVSVVSRGASAIVLLVGEGVRMIYVRDGKAQPITVTFD